MEKGLENKTGENNCFLNVVIQSLWHLKRFRSKFFEWTEHSCCDKEKQKEKDNEITCVHCALTCIFSYYCSPDHSVITPKFLRQTLNNIFRSQERFQIGEIDDATEALDSVLSCLHDSTRKEDGEESCIPHKVFGIDSISMVTCIGCGIQSEPLPNLHFIEYIYSNDICESKKMHPEYSLEYIIKHSNKETRGCPEEDEKLACLNMKNPVKTLLLNVPEVITLGLVWTSTSPSVDEIEETLNIIQPELELDELYEIVDIQKQKDKRYKFRGMICFYGRHYNAYFFNDSIEKWIIFDDATVKKVGSLWSDVLNRCKRGHHQPSVLFYELMDNSDLKAKPNSQPTHQIESIPSPEIQIQRPVIIRSPYFPLTSSLINPSYTLDYFTRYL